MKYTKNRFVIIDGSSLMYRAFFALPLLTTESGKYTNAILGFAKMALKLLDELQPQYAVVAFDKSRHTFRTEIFKDYKGTRDKTPDELISQIPMLHNFTKALGITFIEVDNYEADDIIGTLATKAASDGVESLVITGDRDALQLIRPNLKIIMTKKGITETEIFDDTAFKEKYGIEPKRLIDLKALMGDKSDNIPGVFGVGEKTALKLLTEYDSLEGVYANIDKISGKKLKEKLTADKDMAFLSYKLATINCEMDLSFTAEKYAITPDMSQLKSFCDEYELKSIWRFLNKLYAEPSSEKTVVENNDYTYTTVDKTSIASLISQIKASGVFAYLPVFSGKVPHILCQGIMAEQPSENDHSVLYIPCVSEFYRYIDDLFLDDSITKVTYDLKNTLHCGYSPSGKVVDILLTAYMIDPAANNYTLTSLAAKYLDKEILPYDFKKDDASLEYEASYYLHAFSFSHITDILISSLQEKNLYKLYESTELPLEKVLVSMEKYGVYINSQKLKDMSADIGSIIADLLSDIYLLAETEFNVNSPKQLGEVLFDHLSLPVQKKTKTGYSTNADVLEILRPHHPIIEKILDYRMWSKLKSTYLDAMYELIDNETHRIHTTFNQTVTATGRLSSSDPNLQNIPVRTEAGKKIRSLFEPAKDYDLFLSADYSQIELRILAHMSDDKNFIEAFKLEQDIHSRTASEVFGVPLDEVTSELRRRAKAINFGLVYGKSDYGLAQELHISRQEAAEYINSYFTKYNGVKKCLDDIVEEAHQKGYTTTLFGRRRYLPGIKSSNHNIRMQNERMAMNTPIQGTAADIIKMAMIATWEKIRAQKLKSRILLQVHDELVIEAVAAEVPALKNILYETMQNIVELKVPLTIDINTGIDWAQTK
ncbi:DNA polymerase I [Pectinatus haikarae]|uniref:DNA polymerase I n=1 Tax=Pectinatus haikarae TaxID=349096 RepID=A0ABT9Y955_9FIRM|nr:DNA polymerase I [Pectinatus haikarae]MDQ0203654.1 DNA polymerase-1 [Pectinatus haikarae]